MDLNNEWAASNARKHITMLYAKIEKVDAENAELKETLAKERACVNAMMDLVKDFCVNKGGDAYSENLDIVLMRQCNALVAKVHGTDAEGLMALR